MTDEHNPEAVARMRALADCDSRAGEPLGKALREAADMLEALAAKLAEAEAAHNRMTHDWGLADRARMAAEADLSRLRTAQDAMVGAAYEAAAQACDAMLEIPRGKPSRAAAAVSALTPADATSALERMLREARNAALELAANEAEEHKLFAKGIDCLPECIRKLKEQPE